MEPVCQKPPIAGWFHIAMRLQHSFWTAGRTPAGYEAMAMVRKGQVRNIDSSDIRARAHRWTVPRGRPTRHFILRQITDGQR
jgi:hypothetical protein